MQFNERLKALREDNDITQTELEKAVYVTQRNISFYETGANEPDIKTIIALARFFNVTTDYILGISDKRKT